MNVKNFIHQILYFCIGLLIIFFQILPLQTTPQSWSGPNVLLVFFAAIVIKRPEFTSSLLIAVVFLIEDFFLMRPPGLMSSLTVLGLYILKRKFQNQEDTSLVFVWGNVAICLTLILLICYFVSKLLFIPSADLRLTIMEITVTLAIFPIFSMIIGSFDNLEATGAEKIIQR
jgi:rod shape-determining protein MreD